MAGVSRTGVLRLWRGLTIAVVSGISMAACATTPPPSSHMPAGAIAMPPAGLMDMCQRMPEVCGDAGHMARAAISGEIVLASAAEPATGAVTAGPRQDGAKSFTAPDNAFVSGASTDEPDLLLESEIGADDGLDQPTDKTGKEENDIAGAQVTEPAFMIDENGQLVADSHLFSVLNRVNQSVNMAIRPRDDREVHGQEEYWTLPLSLEGPAEGDCEDYALEKRQALLAAGIPEHALFLAVGYSRATGRHAVLIVSTHTGDYVLDNMTPHIVPWSQTPYTWLLRQVPGDLLAWRRAEMAVS